MLRARMMTYIVARVTADSNMATAMVVCSLETRSDNTTLSHSRRPGADLGGDYGDYIVTPLTLQPISCYY